ncbi:hypothetical protein IAT38_005872 [Cryptococcus sp. DSM 104549]
MSSSKQIRDRSSDDGDDEPPQPPAKKRPGRGNRNQTIVSCLECRRMKWKCDRVFPCSNCRKRGLESLCPHGQLNGSKGDRQLISDMQARINSLEKALADAQQQLEATPQEHPQSPSDSSYPSAGLPDPQAVSVGDGMVSRDDSQGDSSESREDHGQLTLGEGPGSSRFFGGAGTQYLMHAGKEKMDAAESDSLGHSSVEELLGLPDSFPLLGRAMTMSMEDIMSYMPNHDAAHHFAQLYFEHGCVNHNIVTEPEFYALLDEMYQAPAVLAGTSKRKENNHRLAVVLLVLAIGAQMDLALKPYNNVGETFYRLARAAIAHDPSSSLALVQSVILMSRYQSNSGKTVAYEAFWPVLGMGIRCAQQIGLHRDGRNWRLPERENELRRRVYWEEDTLQSMSQGRPRATNEMTVDAAFPAFEDGNLSEIFYHFKYRISLIFARVNTLFSNVKSPTFKQVMQVDKAVRQLESELPRELLPETQLSPAQATHRILFQRLILRLYINEALIFAHRSHFARALRDSRNEPLQSAYSFSYVAELEASRVMISVLRDATAINSQIAARYWIFWFHAFMAIHNFSVAVVRVPHSSLAAAALSQIEEGVRVYEGVGAEYKAHSDLPILKHLLEKARQALTLQDPNDDSFPADLLGVGTTLRRVTRPEHLSTSSQAATSDVPPADTILPTTLADAVAHQSSLFPSPFDVDHLDSLSPPFALPQDGVGALEGMGEWPLWPGGGDGGDGGVPPHAAFVGNPDQNFDAFLASIIGVDPISLAGSGGLT